MKIKQRHRKRTSSGEIPLKYSEGKEKASQTWTIIDLSKREKYITVRTGKRKNKRLKESKYTDEVYK